MEIVDLAERSEGLTALDQAELEASQEQTAREIYRVAKCLYDHALADWKPGIPAGYRVLDVKASIFDMPLFDFAAGLGFTADDYISNQPEHIVISLSGKERIEGNDIAVINSVVTFDAEGLVSIDYLPEEYDSISDEQAESYILETHHRILSMMSEATDESLRFEITFFGAPREDTPTIDTQATESSLKAAIKP
ncbi:hypothetical protein KBD20_04575 [Candidatus Saccharibacteria bacterium]|nr:hypothetical protein [Candidatus Saccharibacteria bacterium]